MPQMMDDLPLGELDDLQLVRKSREGRKDAFGELVTRYQDRVYNLVLRLTGNPDDASEAAQEAFLKAWRALDAFRGDSAFYTWLFRIAVNEARTRQRSRLARPAALSLNGGGKDGGEERTTPAPASNAPDPADEAARAEDRRLVEDGLRRLDSEQREIIVLRDIEGRDYDEIADVLGCPRGTVKSRLHRARSALRDLLAPAMGFARTQES